MGAAHPKDQAKPGAGDQAEGVEQRQWIEDDVAAGLKVQRVRHAIAVGQDLAMGQLDALGVAGGTAREDDCGDVPWAAARKPARRQQQGQRHAPGDRQLGDGRQDLFEVDQARGQGEIAADAAQVEAGGDDRAHPRHLDHARDLRGARRVVEIDRGAPGNGERGVDDRSAASGRQQHADAGFVGGKAEPADQRLGQGHQLQRGDGAPGIVYGDVPRVTLGLAQHGGAERAPVAVGALLGLFVAKLHDVVPGGGDRRVRRLVGSDVEIDRAEGPRPQVAF